VGKVIAYILLFPITLILLAITEILRAGQVFTERKVTYVDQSTDVFVEEYTKGLPPISHSAPIAKNTVIDLSPRSVLSVEDVKKFLVDLPEGTCPLYSNQEGVWAAVKIDDLNVESIPLLDETATQLVKFCNHIGLTSELLPVVECVNTIWTGLRQQHGEIGIPPQEEAVLRFSSRHRGVCWLSNFYPTLVPDLEHGKVYRTVEHAYVAYKGVDAGMDPTELEKLLEKPHPGSVKKKGAKLKRENSDEQRQRDIEEMRRLEHLKFTHNRVLRELLLNTQPFDLQEDTKDTFWGTGNGKITTEGSNHLGKILMQERTSLRNSK
jgi:ribA/ribD-fused uncharacterized protein